MRARKQGQDAKQGREANEGGKKGKPSQHTLSADMASRTASTHMDLCSDGAPRKMTHLFGLNISTCIMQRRTAALISTKRLWPFNIKQQRLAESEG